MNGNYIIRPGEGPAVQQESTEATQAQREAPRWGDSARFVGNIARITVSGGQESIENVANVQHGEWTELSKRDDSSSILSTARSLAGRPVSGADARPDSIVKVGGMETSVRAACAAGLLQRNGDGSYSEVGGTAASHPTARPAAHDEPGQNEQQQEQQNQSADKVAEPPAPGRGDRRRRGDRRTDSRVRGSGQAGRQVFAWQVGWRPSGARGSADGMVHNISGPGRKVGPADAIFLAAALEEVVNGSHGDSGDLDLDGTVLRVNFLRAGARGGSRRLA